MKFTRLPALKTARRCIFLNLYHLFWIRESLLGSRATGGFEVKTSLLSPSRLGCFREQGPGGEQWRQAIALPLRLRGRFRHGAAR
jgi:hypothetical protein